MDLDALNERRMEVKRRKERIERGEEVVSDADNADGNDKKKKKGKGKIKGKVMDSDESDNENEVVAEKKRGRGRIKKDLIDISDADAFGSEFIDDEGEIEEERGGEGGERRNSIRHSTIAISTHVSTGHVNQKPHIKVSRGGRDRMEFDDTVGDCAASTTVSGNQMVHDLQDSDVEGSVQSGDSDTSNSSNSCSDSEDDKQKERKGGKKEMLKERMQKSLRGEKMGICADREIVNKSENINRENSSDIIDRNMKTDSKVVLNMESEKVGKKNKGEGRVIKRTMHTEMDIDYDSDKSDESDDVFALESSGQKGKKEKVHKKWRGREIQRQNEKEKGEWKGNGKENLENEKDKDRGKEIEPIRIKRRIIVDDDDDDDDIAQADIEEVVCQLQSNQNPPSSSSSSSSSSSFPLCPVSTISQNKMNSMINRKKEIGRGKENDSTIKVNNGVIFLPKKKLIDDDKNLSKSRKTPMNPTFSSISFSSLSPSAAPSSSSVIASTVRTSSIQVRAKSDDNDGLTLMDRRSIEDVTAELSADDSIEVQGRGEVIERYWTCAACTFSNDCDTDSRKCCMCDARRVGMVKRNSESGGDKSERAIERKETGTDRNRDTDRDRDRDRVKDKGIDRESGGKRKIPFGDSLASLHTTVTVQNNSSSVNTGTGTSTSTKSPSRLIHNIPSKRRSLAIQR